jgi:hypothetical protein
MVFKLFSITEQNPEPGGIAYVMRNPTARVLLGDPVITQAVINSTPSYVRQRFTAGVACEEKRLSSLQESLIADTLDYHLRGGRPAEAVANCMVAQSDKGNSEIHFVGAHMDLAVNKVVNPYIDRIDRHRFRAVTELINLRYGFEDPMDRCRVEPLWDHMRINNTDKEFLKRVWQDVHDGVKNGLVHNRNELAAFLGAKGYLVRSQKHDGGHLAQPVIQAPSGRQLRLKGSIYYTPDFGDTHAQQFNRNDPLSVANRIKQLEWIIRQGLEFRAYWTIGRLFGKSAQEGVDKGAALHTLDTLFLPHVKKLRQPEPALNLFTFREVETIQIAKEIGLEMASVPILTKGERNAPASNKEAPQTHASHAPEDLEISQPAPIQKSKPKPVEELEAKSPTTPAKPEPNPSAHIVFPKKSKRRKPRQPSEPADPEMLI